MAILGGAKDCRIEVDGPELGDVIYNNEVRIQVNHPGELVREQIREINPGVIQRLVECAPNRYGYLVPDEAGIEGVNLEI